MSDEHYHVVALDPGVTTGYARAVVTFGGPGVPTFDLKAGIEIVNFTMMEGVFLIDLHMYRPVVIVESFNLFAHKAQSQTGSTFPSAEMIGVIKYLLWSNGFQEPIMQTPNQKSQITDYMLRERFEIDKLTSSPHIRDAMRHIVFWGLEKRYGSTSMATKRS